MNFNKLYKVYSRIEPLLEKKIPFFAQTVKQFGSSKSNWLGTVCFVIGLFTLYQNTDSSLGYNLIVFGSGLFTLKDAVIKKG